MCERECVRVYVHPLCHAHSAFPIFATVISVEQLSMGYYEHNCVLCVQVKELGVLAMDCECLARDAEQLFAVYWNLTSPTARIPKPWPSQYNAMFNLSHPALISLNSTPALAYWSVSHSMCVSLKYY